MAMEFDAGVHASMGSRFDENLLLLPYFQDNTDDNADSFR
jgi:hypothetical protein